MLDRTFHTPAPFELEVGIPSGRIEVEIRQDGNRVVVAYRGKSKFSFAPFALVFSNDLRVRATVPHGANIKLKTASGDSKLNGHFGSVALNSVSGDIRVQGDVAGDVTIKTVSGDADLPAVGRDLSLQSVSGDLRVGAVKGSAEAKTVSGDIRVGNVAAGDVSFTSVSGDVEIGIAQGSSVDVDAGSTSGDLSSEVPLASEPGAAGAGGPTVVVRGRTVSGDVKVSRAS